MDCLLVNGKVWITFWVARWWSGKKASHSPRWAIQRRKNLPPGWIVGIRLTESNNAVLDYLLMPTRALVGRMVKFTEKARCRHKASRFETVDDWFDQLLRGQLKQTVPLQPNHRARKGPEQRAPPKAGMASRRTDGTQAEMQDVDNILP